VTRFLSKSAVVSDWGLEVLGVARDIISALSYLQLGFTPGDFRHWLAFARAGLHMVEIKSKMDVENMQKDSSLEFSREAPPLAIACTYI
jgi:hypothetical protein